MKAAIDELELLFPPQVIRKARVNRKADPLLNIANAALSARPTVIVSPTAQGRSDSKKLMRNGDNNEVVARGKTDLEV